MQHIPAGYHSVTPYIVGRGVAHLIEFLKTAFDAQEIERMARPDGSIGHAEVKIGDSIIMMADANEKFGPMPTNIYLYVKDTDAAYKRALASGAISLMEPADQFYGDRNAGVKDSLGNFWWIGTHIEDVPADELKRRAEAWGKQQAGHSR